tara:strand:- start:72 stop:740 length:669 start_codon:yes stop_codon:yes gene_type:complete
MNVYELAGIETPETKKSILSNNENQFPFDPLKIDWELIAQKASSVQNNTDQMERMLASKFLETSVVYCSGGQFRYVGDDETGVDFRVNGTDVGIELKTGVNLFQKTGSTKKIDFTSFRSAEKTAANFIIQCDYLLLIDKSPDKFRVRGTSKELLEKYRNSIFEENKSGIQAKIPGNILTDIFGPIQLNTYKNLSSPITEMFENHRKQCISLYEERNCKGEFK